jgi:hypothetical protein
MYRGEPECNRDEQGALNTPKRASYLGHASIEHAYQADLAFQQFACVYRRIFQLHV